MDDSVENYKKVFLEMICGEGVVPTVWSAYMYSSFKEYLSEDEEGYKCFQGKRIYFVNEKDGTLVDWRELDV